MGDRFTSCSYSILPTFKMAAVPEHLIEENIEELYPPKYTVEGIHFTFRARDIDIDVIEKFRKLEFRPTDVVMSGYPRSGTTWTEAVVWLILNDADLETFRTKNQHEPVCSLDYKRPSEVPMIDKVEGFPNPRVMFTHMHYKLLAPKFQRTNNKVIYCWRNPKDVAVSFYQATTTWAKDECIQVFGKEIDFSFCLEYMCSSVCDNGSYFDQVLPWWEDRNNPNILFVYYEDMKEDPEGGIRQIASFLGKDLSDKQVNDIMEATSIDTMRKTYAEVKMPESLKNFNKGGGIGKGV